MKKRNYCLKRAINYLYEALNIDPSTQMENLKKQYPTKNQVNLFNQLQSLILEIGDNNE